MRYTRWAIGAILAVWSLLSASAASAQHVPSSKSEMSTSTEQEASWSNGASRRLHESASECPPDQPEPIWGVGNRLLGYECKTPSANGN